MPFVGAAPIPKPEFPLWIEESARNADVPDQGARREVRGRPPMGRWYRGSSVAEVSDRPWSVGGSDVAHVVGDETWLTTATSGDTVTVSHIGPGASDSVVTVDLCTAPGRYIHLSLDAKKHVVGFTINGTP